MIALNLISYSIPPLTLDDSPEKAIQWMNDFHVRHLPVLREGKLEGILSEDEALNSIDPDLPISECGLALIHKSVTSQQHLFELMKFIVDTDLTIIPVVDSESKYIGLVTIESLIKFFAETVSITQPGGIITLEMYPRDYSLAEISRIIESENTKIISCFVSSPYGKEMLEVTLKLSKQDLKHVIATLQRFGYQVKNSFYEDDLQNDLQERFNALMKYLNP